MSSKPSFTPRTDDEQTSPSPQLSLLPTSADSIERMETRQLTVNPTYVHVLQLSGNYTDDTKIARR